MKTKLFTRLTILLATLVLLFLALRLLTAEHHQKGETATAEKVAGEKPQALSKPADKRAMLPKEAAVNPISHEELCAKFYSALECVDADGWPTANMHHAGMVSPDVAIETASKHINKSSTTNKPDVFLVDEIYVVRFYRHPNPFQAGRIRGLHVGIDARTGNSITGLRGGGGAIRINIRKETGATNAEDAERYRKRFLQGANTLGKNIFYGREWESEAQPKMISKEDALAVAKRVVEGREHDRAAEPLVLLVDDLYIVAFWKPGREKLADFDTTYDSRVGIDAYTGEFIAMETTRGKRKTIRGVE